MRSLILVVFLLGCGSEPHPVVWMYPSIKEVPDQVQDQFLPKNNATFDPYREFFELHTGHDTNNVPIAFGKVHTASCRPRIVFGKWHNKKIYVNKYLFLNEMTDNHRRAIIAHELVHCHLEIKQHETYDPGRFVLMAPALNLSEEVTEEELIDQLSLYR